MKYLYPTRRELFKKSLSLSPFFCTPGLMAEALTLTPRQTEGPFYPDKMPLDTDNDLLIINDSITPAVGIVAYLRGKVTDVKGNPQRNALIEIWQVDNNGVYLHSRGGSRKKLDSNFQGYGRFLTDSKGNYFFRTLKPSPYSGRTPHIHMSVSAKGKEKFTTQCYIKGEPRNEKDFILKRVKDSNARNSLIVPFNPVKGSKVQEVSAKFDIVLGWTPEG
jgi:protocatechuate 3,4-dioxygenase beta subunit